MTLPARRPLCPQCLRPQSACICALAHAVATHTQVLILQHPMEVREAKGTARLLHLCLGASSRLEVGETFDPAHLHALLHAPWQPGDALRQAVLLYPQSPEQPAPVLTSSAQAGTAALRLVILDGTWRKSRKMLYANPALQGLPRLALSGMAPAAYTIRKAQRAGQLSTMEAATHALQALEAWPANAPALHSLQLAFAALMLQHQQLRPGT